MKIKLKARAKINLSLEVIGKRLDGYHDLSMIMQSIDIYDKIELQQNSSGAITLEGNYGDIPLEKNLAFKAAKAFFEYTNSNMGCDIKLEKQIPMEAGLAGGSTDAAGVILGLDKLSHTNLSNQQLIEIGSSVGADVPFCIFGGTMLAEGIGDRLTRLENLSLNLLVAKPSNNVSTKELFSILGKEDYSSGETTLGLAKIIQSQNLQAMNKHMVNGMYNKSLRFAPQMKDIILQLEKQEGCLKAMMSGSGSTVFGIFETVTQRDCAMDNLQNLDIKQNKDLLVYGTKTASESITFY